MRRDLRKWFSTFVLLIWVFAGVSTVVSAQQPDPAGIATGDKTNAVDAGGNAFVVPSRPTRPLRTTPTKKKAFDEYQAQAAKEPLAVKAGRHRRARADRHQLGVDAEHRLPRAVHAGRLRAADVRPGPQEERRRT